MCLQALAEIFGNAIGIILGTLFLLVILFYLVGFLIGAFIGGVALLVLALTNPVTWVVIGFLVLGGLIFVNK
ncbi:hypothetical protein DSECCO2_578390 [anaerobic digester metagenome]